MSLWYIAWSYLWNRKLTTCLTVFSVALAVGLISSVLSLRQEIERRFVEEGQAFDLVVGPKGSPLTLVLSSVYFLDNPMGFTPVEVYEQLKQDEDFVQAAFPINLGDSFRDFRMVGTVRELFDHTWESSATGQLRRPFVLKKDGQSRFFRDKMEAVLGAVVARQTGLKLGDRFRSIHGMYDIGEDMREFDHDDTPYTVVGILEPSSTPYDRAIYCNLESVWSAHELEDLGATGEYGERSPESRVSAVLVQLHTPGLRWEYEAYINESTGVMAAIPIRVIQKFFDQLLQPVQAVLLAVGYLVVVISALSVLIGLYLSILQRKRDLAVMCALGASAYEIFGAVIIEAFWVTTLGIACGWLLGNVVTYGLGQYMAQQYGLVITPFGISHDEIRAFASVAIVGLLAGVLPAWQAYNSDVARDLAER